MQKESKENLAYLLNPFSRIHLAFLFLIPKAGAASTHQCINRGVELEEAGERADGSAAAPA